jgi:hypothetical protein
LSGEADWLPSLIEMAHANNVWADYCEMVYQAFYADFISSQPQFRACWVRCRRDPFSQGKEAGFWHCVSSGDSEESRTPEMCRCERIRWPKAIIEHSTDRRVDVWPTTRGRDKRVVFWFEESYLIILAERMRKRDGSRYYQLITAYVTEFERRKQTLRAERDAARNG